MANALEDIFRCASFSRTVSLLGRKPLIGLYIIRSRLDRIYQQLA